MYNSLTLIRILVLTNLVHCYSAQEDGVWTAWTDWSTCSADCLGTQQRHRKCLTSICKGFPGEIRYCGDFDCEDNDWSSWGPWNPCTVSCGKGTRTRWRQCLIHHCHGEAEELQVCDTHRCSGITQTTIPPFRVGGTKVTTKSWDIESSNRTTPKYLPERYKTEATTKSLEYTINYLTQRHTTVSTMTSREIETGKDTTTKPVGQTRKTEATTMSLGYESKVIDESTKPLSQVPSIEATAAAFEDRGSTGSTFKPTALESTIKATAGYENVTEATSEPTTSYLVEGSSSEMTSESSGKGKPVEISTQYSSQVFTPRPLPTYRYRNGLVRPLPKYRYRNGLPMPLPTYRYRSGLPMPLPTYRYRSGVPSLRPLSTYRHRSGLLRPRSSLQPRRVIPPYPRRLNIPKLPYYKGSRVTPRPLLSRQRGHVVRLPPNIWKSPTRAGLPQYIRHTPVRRYPNLQRRYPTPTSRPSRIKPSLRHRSIFPRRQPLPYGGMRPGLRQSVRRRIIPLVRRQHFHLRGIQPRQQPSPQYKMPRSGFRRATISRRQPFRRSGLTSRHVPRFVSSRYSRIRST